MQRISNFFTREHTFNTPMAIIVIAVVVIALLGPMIASALGGGSAGP